MKLFHPDNRNRSEAHKRIYAIHELAYTINDVGAAALFVIGSILFFKEATAYADKKTKEAEAVDDMQE